MNDMIQANHDVLERCANRVEVGARMTAEGALMTGQALCEARDALHGNTQAFGKWREERLPWLHRNHALRCMHVWENLGPRLMHHSDASEFSNTVLFALAAPSTPEEVRDAVFERTQQGERVTVADVERLKREAQQERETRQQLSAKLDQVQQQNQILHDNLAAASEREQRTYREMQDAQAKIDSLADQKSQAAIEQARREAEAAQQRVDELREELAHKERQKAFAIREGIQNGLAARQAEVDTLNRAISQAEAELTDVRQRLKERTGADHENQRLHIDTEKALRELMVLGTTLNLFEAPVIYTVNGEMLDRLIQVAEAIVPRILDFKADHRLMEWSPPP